MSLANEIKRIIYEYINSASLTEMAIGKVTSIDPLEVTLQDMTVPIPSEFLMRTENVIETTIDDVKHLHDYYDQDTGEGAQGSENRKTENALLNIQAYKNGTGVGLGHTLDGKIILNKALEVGEMVLLMRVKKGQKYLILSRIY